MSEKKRAENSLEKLTGLYAEMEKEYGKKYPTILSHAYKYMLDARYFLEAKDYFSSFGASDYSYGLLEAILFIEGKK